MPPSLSRDVRVIDPFVWQTDEVVDDEMNWWGVLGFREPSGHKVEERLCYQLGPNQRLPKSTLPLELIPCLTLVER